MQEERHYRTWVQVVREEAENNAEYREMLAWLEQPFEETYKEWAEEEYQEWRTNRRKRLKEKRRK